MSQSIEASELGWKPGEWPSELEHDSKTWYKSYPMHTPNTATKSKRNEPGIEWVLYRTKNHEAMRVYND